MKKTLIISGALAGILGLTPILQAAQFSFEMRLYLPPRVALIDPNHPNAELLKMNQAAQVHTDIQEYVLDGRTVMIQTSLVR